MNTIAIDYTPAYEQGAGIGRYVRELVSALAEIDDQRPYRLFVSGATRDQLHPPPTTNFQWRPTRLSPRNLARIWHRLHVPLPVELFTGPVELFHATDFVLPPHLPGTKTILTVHDLSFIRVPDAANPRLRAYLGQVVPRSLKRADLILADSLATKRDILDEYRIDENRVVVLLSGVSARFRRVENSMQTMRKKYKFPDRPYIFSVGTVQPRKNYERLVLALAALRSTGLGIDLVIAGGKGWLEDPIHKTVADSGMSEHVHFIGYADDDDLPALYSAATCVAFPSLYEGFGFPVLESMACGTPVITSDVSSLPEVAGDAAIMVDPYDLQAIIDALSRVITDPDLRNRMIEAGYQQAARFTWHNSARHLLEIYNTVLNSN